MKNYLLLNLLLSFSIIASLELEANAKFSECQGKVANYYLSNLVDGGSVEGWLKAAAMHEKYYNDRNFKVGFPQVLIINIYSKINCFLISFSSFFPL